MLLPRGLNTTTWMSNTVWLSQIYNSQKKTRHHTSLHTSMVPNTTWRPSKKLSPMMMTVAPPVVHPSLGLMALMHGVAANPRQREELIQHLSLNTLVPVSLSMQTHWRITSTSPSQRHIMEIAAGKKKKKWWICPLRHENQNHLSARWSGVVKQTLQMVHFTKAKRRARKENDLMEQIMCRGKCSYQNWLSMHPHVQ